MTKNEIIDALFKDQVIDDMITNITGGNPLRNDLKQELFVILLEMPGSKILDAYSGKWLTYLCVNIITKQWRSTTSPFYKKFRKETQNSDWKDLPEEEGIDWLLINEIVKEIEDLPFVERELLKMRYKLGDWGVGGSLEDRECKKVITSYRKIERKLKIGDISIDHNTIQKYHNKSIDKIKKKLKGKI